TGFRISIRHPGAVEVVIRVDADAPVRQSTRAVVERHLITGIASIRLVNLDETSPPLVATPEGEAYPLIAEGASTLEQFSESVAQLAQHADETMQRINTTLSAENQRALAEVLKNLQRVSSRAEQSLAGLDRTLASADRALASVSGAAEEVRATSRSVGEDAHQVALRYDKLGEESTGAVREAAASIRQMSADVARVSQRLDGLLATGDAELRVTAQELRATAAIRAASCTDRRREASGRARPSVERWNAGWNATGGCARARLPSHGVHFFGTARRATLLRPRRCQEFKHENRSRAQGDAAARADHGVQLLRYTGHRLQPRVRDALVLPIPQLDRAARSPDRRAARGSPGTQRRLPHRGERHERGTRRAGVEHLPHGALPRRHRRARQRTRRADRGAHRSRAPDPDRAAQLCNFGERRKL